ncbi:MAG: shikimate dehydrogenase [Arachnia propionica]|nr:MAG: shikimate dehydrogenase [Arachnia propionica]
MRCAVIGSPVAHSLSPALHRDGYRRHGLEWRYEAIELADDEVSDFVAACASGGDWAGLSVTAPHKQRAATLGDPDHLVRLLQVANTITFHPEAKVHNTDVSGFLRAWHHHGLKPPKRAVILGNGATARSVLVALAGLNVTAVTVLARRASSELVQLGATLGVTVTCDELDADPAEVSVVVNTIPAAATEPIALRLVAQAKVVFDVLYDPWPTPLASAAQQLGRPCLSGIDLLAGQAVDQFQLFTGLPLAFADARRSAVAELARRGNVTQ